MSGGAAKKKGKGAKKTTAKKTTAKGAKGAKKTTAKKTTAKGAKGAKKTTAKKTTAKGAKGAKGQPGKTAKSGKSVGTSGEGENSVGSGTSGTGAGAGTQKKIYVLKSGKPLPIGTINQIVNIIKKSGVQITKVVNPAGQTIPGVAGAGKAVSGSKQQKMGKQMPAGQSKSKKQLKANPSASKTAKGQKKAPAGKKQTKKKQKGGAGASYTAHYYLASPISNATLASVKKLDKTIKYSIQAGPAGQGGTAGQGGPRRKGGPGGPGVGGLSTPGQFKAEPKTFLHGVATEVDLDTYSGPRVPGQYLMGYEPESGGRQKIWVDFMVNGKDGAKFYTVYFYQSQFAKENPPISPAEFQQVIPQRMIPIIKKAMTEAGGEELYTKADFEAAIKTVEATLKKLEREMKKMEQEAASAQAQEATPEKTMQMSKILQIKRADYKVNREKLSLYRQLYAAAPLTRE
jgi:hypothetical protein